MLKKYPYILEIPIFFLLFYFINDLLFPEFPGFLGKDPHPYWIAIFLFGLKYGVEAGMTSGFAAAGMYLGMVWMNGDRTLFEDLNFYFLPSLFIVAGVLIGFSITRKKAQVIEVEAQRDSLLETQQQLDFKISTLTEINRELEKKVVSRMTTLVTLYEGARRLEETEVSALYKSIVEFTAKTLEGKGVSFFLKSAEQWVMREKIGDVEGIPSHLKLNEGLVGLAGMNGKVFTVRDLVDMPSSTSVRDCVMAGPIRDGNGNVMGVLALHDIPLVRLNSATINLFSFLLQWAGRAIKRCVYIDELKSGEIMDQQYPVYSQTYYLSRLKQEFLRSKKYYLPLSFGMLKLSGIHNLEEKQKRKLMLTVATLLKNATRDIDIVAATPNPDYPFVILMITASENQANEIRDLVMSDIRKIEWDGFAAVSLDLQVGSFNPRMEHEQELVDAAYRKFKQDHSSESP